MKTFEIYVSGEPVAKARPRITKGGHVYTPSKTQEHESRIREEWREAYGLTPPGKDGVILSLVFYMTKPKNKKGLKETPQKRPDIDNLIKTVLDALNGLAYEDDKQIVQVIARKEWSPRDLGYTRITVYAEE